MKYGEDPLIRIYATRQFRTITRPLLGCRDRGNPILDRCDNASIDYNDGDRASDQLFQTHVNEGDE